jgi:hypothetical protein
MKAVIAGLAAAGALALAPAANATAFNMVVQVSPTLGGAQVTVTDTTSPNDLSRLAEAQCTYDATAKGGLGALVAPSHHDFTLPYRGTAQFTVPGVQTGTVWAVTVVCHGINSHNQTAQTGSFNADLTY